jgi:hypothetical protein
MKSFMIYTPHKILLQLSNQGRRDGLGLWPIGGRTEMHKGFGGDTSDITWKT